MRVERFQAQDMAQALAMIKERLGPDAVILHSRRIRRGWLRRPLLEVIAAVDLKSAARAQAGHVEERQPVWALPREVQAELAALREVIARLTWEVRSARLPALERGLQMAYSQLLSQSLSPELAADVVLAAASELSAVAAADEETAKSCVARHLRSKIPTYPMVVGAQMNRVVFVIGPTGVGKTTTLVKLASYCAREHHRPVVLVSVDTIRLGGAFQLQRYGSILGIPVEIAYTPEELTGIVQAQTDQVLILVDTPGQSQHDQAGLKALREFLLAVPSRSVYLAVACTTAYQEMEEIVRHFSLVPLDGLVFTKADEATSIGAAVSLAWRYGLPVSCITTGRRVPTDWELASAEDLANRVIQGSLWPPSELSPRLSEVFSLHKLAADRSQL
ncbi:MAG: flagellar biosynthesis protein FlhF [Anaerolineae bacterium]|nr:flagellar biosynthesis protein FlhF [Anaerolineae bacterium]MDW8099688.1 flagellar biosynthesis protein FlhF [Anaerolineae bacterium]